MLVPSSNQKSCEPQRPDQVTNRKRKKRNMICHQILNVLTCWVVVLLLLLFPLLTHCLTNAGGKKVPAPAAPESLAASAFTSLLDADQASSSSDTEKEITFISVNGNHINVNTTTTITTTTPMPTTAQPTVTPTNEVNASESHGITRGQQPSLRRSKRYLDFLETSRMFFRVNIKNNIIPKPTVWAHAYGFRCNYPIENDKKVRPFRRDTYEALGDLMAKSGFDGQACILKAYCAAHMDAGINMGKGMLFKLMEYIFKLSDEDRRHFPYLHPKNCQQILHSHCPLSFNSISPYTDDV